TSRKSRYITFTSLEAAYAIDAYLEFRRLKGDPLRSDAPFIRNEIGESNQHLPKPLTRGAIADLIGSHLVSLGIRRPADLNVGKRQETPLMHGFRSNFTTALT